eukprot:Seg349.10 transcript_id=Seg349.10/GoldUCD/mRNA.D3Y31 product="Protein STPG4" protein_id=Seg349.10/GoldUCD/D3Y31
MSSPTAAVKGKSPAIGSPSRDFFQEENVDLVSAREWWWRRTIKNTPIPGTYEVKTFLDDLNAQPISKSYGFKSEGRKKNADPSRKGHYLMPGLYQRKDSIVDELQKKKMTYSFAAVSREDTNAVVTGMKDMKIQKSQISPATYDPGYTPVEKLPIRHPVFKSQSRRFPTIYFTPKVGPAPGQYDSHKTSEVNNCLKATAPFKSRTARFTKPHVLRTPGPGAYTKMNQMPMPNHIRSLGRYHGLFFPPGIY